MVILLNALSTIVSNGGIMDWNDDLITLRGTLIRLYSEKPDIERIVDAAGLARADIKFQGKVINIWHSVIEEAYKRQRLTKVIEAASKGIQENQYLQEAKLKNWYANDSDANPGSDTPKHPPNVYLRRAVEQCFLSVDEVRTLCQGYFPDLLRRVAKKDYEETVLMLIDYCNSRGKADVIWDYLKVKCPTHHKKYYHLWRQAVQIAEDSELL